MQGPVISILILQTVLCTTAGLTLTPASDLTLQNFSLVCDFGVDVWTSSLFFTYDGSSAGGCTAPPGPTCQSTLGSITTDNTQKATLTLNPSNILSNGNAVWQCTHAGLSAGVYNATVIAVCSDGEVKQNNDKVDIKCSCGFPSVKATLKYKINGIGEDEEAKVIDLQSSTGNCVDDSRAADFSYSVEDIPVGAEELCVSFTTLSQISAPEEKCAPIGTVTTDYTTKATTNSTSSIVNSTACSTKSTSCSTISPTTTHVMIIVLPSVGCGGLIIIIIIVIILKQRHLKTPKNNISQTQQKTGLENAACSNL